MNAIEFKDISKSFYVFEKDYKLISWILTDSKKAILHKVLNDISFSVKKGEILGIIGKNGAGKSTILNLIQSTCYPQKGKIIINGRIGSFVNLGAGLFEEYTGRENVYYKCLLIGIEKKEVDTFIEDIVDFTEIGEYFDMPLKTYSSGMRARLGFSISIFTNPDIILLDEIFAVGDRKFKEKSGNKLKELMFSDKAVVLTSHDEEQIKQLCTRAIYINNGEIVYDGDVKDSIQLYNKED